MANEKRYIGIRHRVKWSADGDALPTEVCINQTGYDLASEQDELDFAYSMLPTAWVKPEPGDDLSSFEPHHVKWSKLRKNQKMPEGIHKNQIQQDKDGVTVATGVPASYIGLEYGDIVAMTQGGSGDYFAYALARQGEEVGASVMRIPPFVFTKHRGDKSKDDDAKLLAALVQTNPELFFAVSDRDFALIRVREAFIARTDAVKARIACGQRLRQRVIGEIFCRPEGLYPEGGIEKRYDELKANDVIYGALETEEAKRERELGKCVPELDIYRKLFEPIEGCGPRIAAGIIAAIGDIRRFETDAKLKAFCGVHIQKDGKFARLRHGQVANWSPDARQALYLLVDQFNRRPDSHWGAYLLQMKANLRGKHPEPIVGENGKKRYSNGHTHKMALWRTATRFVEWLHKEWWKLERARSRENLQDAA